MEEQFIQLPDRDLRGTPYGYAPNEFKIKEKVWQQKEYDQSWLNQCENPNAPLPPAYEIIAIKIIEPMENGELIDHPYFIYEIRAVDTSQTHWINEGDLLHPLAENDGTWL